MDLFLKIVYRDHPHAYGDKRIKKILKGIAKGSSPRVWGQEQDFGKLVDNFGIIPTRMGTSHMRSLSQARHRDHPHAYGDKLSP